ncbi:MAG TPA: hypothetical protein VKN73_10450 [Desulfosalsimonadaceae bacterium]|nr:hypothetical protein [Desulfosalsimonadaceae bacterium]
MSGINGKDVEFFGKITASMTHEFKNVLAIIKESAGLMEDITKIAPLSDNKHQEKFDNALATVKNQLNRGMELSTVFNRFAHSPDKPRAEINLKDLAERVVLLSDRFARLKHITLAAAPDDKADKTLNIPGNPVWAQMAVYQAVECCLNQLPPACEITVTSRRIDGHKGILIACANLQTDAADFCQSLKNSEHWQELETVMDAINGRAQTSEAEPGIRLLFD